MTISTQVNKVLYSGTGATVYPYTFKVFNDTDLVVIRRAVDGTETTLTLTTHYTVSGVGSVTGGNVTLVGTQAANPPTTGEKLLIKRVVPLTQSTDWVENDDFPAQVIEDAVDRLVCIAQQLQEQMDRSLLAVAQTSTSTTVDPDQIALDAASSAASAAAAAASAAQAATFNPALYIPASNAGDYLLASNAGVANGVATLDSGGLVPLSQLPETGTAKWTNLVAVTDFSTTAASTSSITMNTDLRTEISPGTAIKFTLSNASTYYGICTSIASNAMGIAGAPLASGAGALTALSYGLLPTYTERIQIPGYWSDAADTALILTDLVVPYVWRGPKAYLVQVGAYSRTTDSGANKPRINARIGSTTTDYVSTSNSNAGLEITAAATWYRTVVDIATAKYAVNFGDIIELKTDGNGGNDDAADLTVELVFVWE